MAERKNIDWEAIQREYRAGILSVREIASLYGISHVSIIKRAKKFPGQWKRDLTERVRRAVVRKITTEPATNDVVTTEGKEEEVVENAADKMMVVIRQHRTSIAKLASIEASFAEELEQLNKPATGKKSEKSVALSTKINALLALVTASEKRQKMERQAFGITDGKQGNDEESVTLLVAEGVRPLHG
jgi:hypothetical protein